MESNKTDTRKHPRDAWTVTDAAKKARWRYVLRIPEFRHAFANLSRGRYWPSPKVRERRRAFWNDWGFSDSGIELWHYMQFIRTKPVEEQINFLDGLSYLVYSFPVWKTSETKGGNILVLEIDLNHPKDVLVILAAKEIGDAIEAYRGEATERRRLDRASDYLQVYDLAVKGETFRAIAKHLGSRESTVKSALLAAKRDIGRVKRSYLQRTGQTAAAPTDHPSFPSKKDLPHSEIDPQKHMRQCSKCRKAKCFEDMCREARGFVSQDRVAQREIPGRDTSRIPGK